MSDVLTSVRNENITLMKLETLLAEKFNVIRTSACEIFIKPERKENKDNLIKRVKELISGSIALNINPDIYVKIYRNSSEIVVRVKRIERNSR